MENTDKTSNNYQLVLIAAAIRQTSPANQPKDWETAKKFIEFIAPDFLRPQEQGTYPQNIIFYPAILCMRCNSINWCEPNLPWGYTTYCSECTFTGRNTMELHGHYSSTLVAAAELMLTEYAVLKIHNLLLERILERIMGELK